MANLLKTLLFIVVVVGTAIYLFVQLPQINDWWSSTVKDLTGWLPFKGPVKTSETILTEDQIPAGFTKNQLSTYFGKGKISYNGEIHGIILNFSFSQATDVTGWRIRTNNGETVIPLVVDGYDVANSSNLKDVSVLNGELSIFPGMSATGRNFRLNSCSGYLNNTYSFSPKFSGNCPEINRGEYAGLSGQCQTYILSLGECAVPEQNFMNSLPVDSQGSACRNFLEKINFYGCVNSHKSDADFYLNEWRVWNNQDIVDPEHDWIRLFDSKGLLVDSYIY